MRASFLPPFHGPSAIESGYNTKAAPNRLQTIRGLSEHLELGGVNDAHHRATDH